MQMEKEAKKLIGAQLLLPCPSPCIKHCGIDQTLKCTGCGRTGTQIALWPTIADSERWKILLELPAPWQPKPDLH